MMQRHALAARRHSRGLSLVELMVAMAIGMVILAGLSVLFANNSRTRGEIERSSQKIENGRQALDLVGADLEHAGFLAEFDPRQLPLPAAKPDPCASTAADLRAAMGVHVQGYDDGAATVGCITDVKAGTDVVVVRRATTCIAGVGDCAALAAGAPGFQASSCNDPLLPELATGVVDNFYRLSTSPADFTLTRRDCATAAPVRRYLVRIYYIANNDRPNDGMPTLKRAELGAGGFSSVSVVQGVEHLQVEYGLDTNGDGNPDTYSASPDTYLGCGPATAPTCVEHWASVVTAKLFILSRNPDRSPGHVDTKTYSLGQVADATSGSGAPLVVGPFGDAFKRSVFQEVVRLQNASSRRFSPS